MTTDCNAVPRHVRRALGSVTLLLLGVLPAAGAQEAPRAEARIPWQKSLSVSVGYGEHDGGSSTAESVVLYLARPKVTWVLSGGYQSIIGARGFGLGVGYHRTVADWLHVGAGASTGFNTRGGLFPRYEVGAWGRAVVARGLSVETGYSRWRARAVDSHTDRFGVGVTWYTPTPLIVGGDVAYSIGSPGSTRSWAGGGGITYARWQNLYVGVSVRYGDGSYVLMPSQQLVEFTGWAYNLSVSKYLSPRLSVGVSGGHSDYYGGGAVTITVTRSW